MLSLIATYDNGILIFDKPVKFNNPTKVLVTFIGELSENEYHFEYERIAKKFDFTNIAGKLEWEGDALEEQKRLRDEWK